MKTETKMLKRENAAPKKKGRKSNVERKRMEAATIKQVATKNIADGSGVQFCLEAVNFGDVMKVIPRGVSIDFIEMDWAERPLSLRIALPKSLEGVFDRFYRRKREAADEIDLTFRNKTKHEIQEGMDKLKLDLHINSNDFRVRKLHLSKDGAILRFAFAIKNYKGTSDKRVKTKVLAWVETNRDPVKEKEAQVIASHFKLQPYACKIETVETRIAICTKVQ